MDSQAWYFIAASALIVLLLGVAHLGLTFRGPKLHPRDPALTTSMMSVSPIITKETTMWRAWIGFNASHSQGAILFGVVFAYLSIAEWTLLRSSPFLLITGLLFLLGYVFLGVRYWFSVPRNGIFLATTSYVIALIAIWT